MKKVLSVILTILLALSLIPTISANDNGGFTYKVMFNKAAITGYEGNEKNITIPDFIDDYEVCYIANQAFYGNEVIETVAIPNTITSIGSYAFYNCVNLKCLDVPDSVSDIGNNAFADSPSIKEIKIGANVLYLPINSFAGCASLEKITVNENNEKFCDINGVLFNNSQTKLLCFPGGKSNNYCIPDGTIELGDAAFNTCYKISSVYIPASVTSIGSQCFSKCYLLSSIGLPNSITSIGLNCFYECRSLTTVSLPSEITEIKPSAFYGCDSLMNVSIKNKVTTIGLNAFMNCSSLKSIIIPSSVTEIKTRSVGYYFEGGYHKVEGFVISGYSETAAEQYATDNGFEFIDLAKTVKLGNISGSGTVSTTDALLALKYSSGKTTLEDWQIKAGDVDGNGNVDGVDALLILQYSVGKIDKFPIENR